ncbi:MAG: histidinol-phosphatase [Candidatus Coatesbacteria bacterium]|nr:MAG: histidinol-phosphatase [Candidatus Coatesbacteria bacterium]
MMRLRADLHIHTCLSPCADDLMTPKTVVKTALDRGLGLIAITDHNSTQNVEATVAAAEALPLSVLLGIEITTQEEVHLLGLFDNCQSALAIQEIVYKHLTPGINDEKLFGYQYVVDQDDYVIEENKRLLTGATNLAVDRVASSVQALGGLCIAAHIQRERFGLLYQLGFIPEKLAIDAVEITSDVSLLQVAKRFGCSIDFPVVYDSDAHYPDDIGKMTTTFEVEATTISELKMALKGISGRRIITGDSADA